MEKLPDEVIVHITKFLPLEDVLSSCAVSSRWRDVFGSNDVWRPRCDVDSEEYLRTTPCRVEPKFVSPQPENSTLSPIGRWRIAYMREVHLRGNWAGGNCVKDETEIDCNNSVKFLNNDIVIVRSSQSIELRDTSVSPSVTVAELRCSRNCLLPVVRSDMFITFSDHEDTVQVIEVDLDSRSLSVKHTLRVSESERIITYVIVGNVFLGLSTHCIHIWNLDSGNKLKTEFCSLVNGQYKNMSSSRQIKDCNVIAQGENGDYHCFIYNVKQLSFLSFAKHFQNSSRLKELQSAVVKNYVGFCFGWNVEIYNYNTSLLLHEVPVNCPWVFNMRNCFIFVDDNLDLVELSPSNGAVRYLLSDVDAFMRHGDKLLWVFRDGRESLWMFRPDSTVECPVGARGLEHVNKSHTKIILNPNCGSQVTHKVVNFW